jgi:adenylylsulfate kinase-like enzyme
MNSFVVSQKPKRRNIIRPSRSPPDDLNSNEEEVKEKIKVVHLLDTKSLRKLLNQDVAQSHGHRDSIYSDLVGLCSKFVVTGMCHNSSTNVRPNSVLEQMSEQIDLSD